jgi:hypothetical protein
MDIKRFISTCALVTSVPAQAAWLVDTGTPVGGPHTYNSPSAGASYAASFEIGAASLINAMQVHFAVNSSGPVEFSLHQGSSPTGPAVFTRSLATTASPVGTEWLGFTDLNIPVAAGEWTLALSFDSPFSGLLPIGFAPTNTVTKFWFDHNGSGAWGSSDDGLTMFTRVGGVAAIPEPQAYVMVLAGLTCLVLVRRRIS